MFLVSAGKDRSIIIWDLYTYKVIQMLTGCHSKSIFCIGLYKDGNEQYLISGGISKDLKFWKVANSLK